MARSVVCSVLATIVDSGNYSCIAQISADSSVVSENISVTLQGILASYIELYKLLYINL